MADSRDLDDLHPQVRRLAEALLARCADAGIPLTVTFTTRSLETQAALFAQGRTTPGPIVTKARSGYSFHNYGLALDVVPTELLDLPKWGDTPADQARTDQLWREVGAIGKALGFRWGGDFKQIKDRPHFEWSGGLTLAALRAGERPAPPAGPVYEIDNQPRSDMMKIDIGKLAKVLGQTAVAVPLIVAAIRPVVAAAKRATKKATNADKAGAK